MKWKRLRKVEMDFLFVSLQIFRSHTKESSKIFRHNKDVKATLFQRVPAIKIQEVPKSYHERFSIPTEQEDQVPLTELP